MFDTIFELEHSPAKSMDERNRWLEISNSNAAIAGSPLLLQLRIRSSSANVVIRRLSAASRAARPRNRNNRAAEAAINEVHHRARP